MPHLPSTPEGALLLEQARQHFNAGKLEAALHACDSALALDPNDLATIGLRADALLHLNRLQEAADAYRKIIHQNPEVAGAWKNLAIALTRQNDDQGALSAWQAAAGLQPRNAEIRTELGCVLCRLGRDEEALSELRTALAQDSANATTWNALGVALHQLKRHEEALGAFQESLRLNPKSAETHYNSGLALTALRRFDDALHANRMALAHDRKWTEAWWNAALLLLRMERFEEGWPLYEVRLKRRYRKIFPSEILAIPRWDGTKPKAGERILLLSEQGLGDTLMFCRFAAPLAALGFHVTIQAKPALHGILARAPGIRKVVGDEADPKDFDRRIELLSLPWRLSTRIDSIPFAREPYLFPDPSRVDTWRERLGSPQKPRVALMWRGRENPFLAERSMPLEDLAIYLPHRFDYVRLQRKIESNEKPIVNRLAIRPDPSEIVDFDDAAALIELSDLVVTIDTSIAHLAAGMGKTTWIILPRLAEWRWMEDRIDSPWYPEVKLFRQQSEGSWRPVLVQVAQALQRILYQ